MQILSKCKAAFDLIFLSKYNVNVTTPDCVVRLKDTVTHLEQSVARQEEELGYQEETISNCRSRLAEQEEKLKDLQAEKQAMEDHINR